MLHRRQSVCFHAEGYTTHAYPRSVHIQQHVDMVISVPSNRVRLQRILMRRLGSAKLDKNVACSIMHLCHSDTINGGAARNAGPGLKGWGQNQLNSLVWALGHKNEHVLGYTVWTMCVPYYSIVSLVFRSPSPQRSPIRVAARPVPVCVCFTHRGLSRVFYTSVKTRKLGGISWDCVAKNRLPKV